MGDALNEEGIAVQKRGGLAVTRYLLPRGAVEGNIDLNVILSCCSAPIIATTLLRLYLQSYLNFLKEKTRSNRGEGIAVIPVNVKSVVM